MKIRVAILFLTLGSACVMNCAKQSKKVEPVPAAAVELKKDVDPDAYFGTSLSETESDFIANVVASNYADIKFARLAISRSANKKVKEIAKTLADDHAKVLSG